MFVYGTLTDPERVREVVGTAAFEGAATLRGLHRVDGEYPTLAPGGRVTGRLLRTDDVGALDAYEGVDSGLYVRVAVPVAGDAGSRTPSSDEDGDAAARPVGDAPDGDAAARPVGDDSDGDVTDAGEAAVYVGDPGRLGVDVEWPGEGDFAARVRRYVRANEVVVAVE